MFSGTIKLANIDDYVSPSQQCIKPLMLPQKPNLILSQNQHNQQTAKVSLNDCLACSGCITTAQSLLIEQMSVDQFKKQAQQHLTALILSPQSLVSIANNLHLNIEECIRFIKDSMQRKFKISLIFQSYFANICVLEDFQNQYRKGKFPLLVSECPGWVCYAEKIAHQAVSFMSVVKSPQQVAGRQIKQHFRKEGKKVFVVAVSPCYDKKLEGVRFRIQEENEREVDLVVTAQQFKQLLLQKQQKVSKCRSQQINGKLMTITQNGIQWKEFRAVSDQGTNGYIHFLLRNTKYEIRQGRNKDIIQYITANNKIMAKYYGFRNIQNLVKKIKQGKCPYQVVEVMACPGGCLNGNGMEKAEGKNEQLSNKQFLTTLASLFPKGILTPAIEHKLIQAQYKALKRVETFLNW